MFKLILLITLFTFSTQASDFGNWEISKDGSDFTLSNGKAQAKLPMTNTVPSIVHLEKYGDLTVVHYLASTSGTSLIIEEYYGAVFNRDNKFLGTYPIRYESLSESLNSDAIDQPKWFVSKEELNIVYKELDINEKFSIK